jgi:hypothetical protein
MARHFKEPAAAGLLLCNGLRQACPREGEAPAFEVALG